MNQSRWRGTSPGLSSACWMNELTLPGKNWFNCWTNVSILASCDIDFPNMSGLIAAEENENEHHDRGGKITGEITSESARGITCTHFRFVFHQERQKYNARSSTGRFVFNDSLRAERNTTRLYVVRLGICQKLSV